MYITESSRRQEPRLNVVTVTPGAAPPVAAVAVATLGTAAHYRPAYPGIAERMSSAPSPSAPS